MEINLRYSASLCASQHKRVGYDNAQKKNAPLLKLSMVWELFSPQNLGKNMLKNSTSDKVLHSAEALLENTQHAASGAMDSMTHALNQGAVKAREASMHLQESAHKASLSTANAIRHDPMKSVLIAAATGATLMALIGIFSRSNNRH